ncbi:hypothetical protein QUB70_08105 [Microcoleus sp. A003_D6]|uniref:hypothetical protein n=1 Tax=Microcoleus sp. A003_D6 TaxID=3055266 RepID=UPI002FD3E448
MVNRWLSKVTIAAVLSLPLLGLAAASVFAERVKISVLNNSGKTMTGLYSGSSDEDWGENLLDGPLADRGTFSFDWDSADYEGPRAADCVFDVRADYSDGTYTDLRDINFCKESSINFN